MRHKLGDILVESEVKSFVSLILSSSDLSHRSSPPQRSSQRAAEVAASDNPAWLDAVDGLVRVCTGIHDACMAGTFLESADLPDELVAFVGGALPSVVHTLFRKHLTPPRSLSDALATKVNILFRAVLQLSIDFCNHDILELQRLVPLLFNGQSTPPVHFADDRANAKEIGAAVREEAAHATIGSVARSGAGEALRAGFYRNYGTPLVTRINKEEVYYWPDEQSQVTQRELALVGRRVSVMMSGTTDKKTGNGSSRVLTKNVGVQSDRALQIQGKNYFGELIKYNDVRKEYLLRLDEAHDDFFDASNEDYDSDSQNTAANGRDMWVDLNSRNNDLELQVLPPVCVYTDAPVDSKKLDGSEADIGLLLRLPKSKLGVDPIIAKKEASKEDKKTTTTTETAADEAGNAESKGHELKSDDTDTSTTAANNKQEDDKLVVVRVSGWNLESGFHIQRLDPFGKLSAHEPVAVSANALVGNADVKAVVVVQEEKQLVEQAKIDKEEADSKRWAIRPLPEQSKMVSSMLVDNINFFGMQGGFDRICERISVSSISANTKHKEAPLPICMVHALALKHASRIVTPKHGSEIGVKFCNSLFARCLRMSDSEIKGTFDDDLDSLLTCAALILDLENLRLMLDSLGHLKLSLMLRFLSCSKLERRLYGIKKILEAVTNASNAASNASPSARMPSENSRLRLSVLDVHVSPAILGAWLVDQKVVEELFGSNQHIELMRRSGAIIKFLCVRDLLQEHHLDAIWHGCEGKHEAVLDTLYGLIDMLIDRLPKKLRVFLFGLIGAYPFESYDDRGKTLKLLYSFTVKALTTEHLEVKSKKVVVNSDGPLSKNSIGAESLPKAVVIKQEVDGSSGDNNDSDDNKSKKNKVKAKSKEKKIKNKPVDTKKESFTQSRNSTKSNISSNKNKDLGAEWYGLEVLWRFIQDDSKRTNDSGDLLHEALDYIVALLSDPLLCESLRWTMIEKCMSNLKNNSSVPQSLVLLRRIIYTFPQASKKWFSRDNFRSEPRKQWSIIETLEQKYHMIKQLFEDILLYHGCFKSAMLANQEDPVLLVQNNGVSGRRNVNLLRLSGSCYNHLEQLQHRLEFLMFVLKSSSLRVAQKTVGLLWKALVRQAYSPEARDLALRWFGDALIPSLGAGGIEDVPEATEVNAGTSATTTSTSPAAGQDGNTSITGGMAAMWSDDKQSQFFSAFSDDVMKYVFTHEMPTMNVAQLSVTAIQVYHLYFVTMNHKERNVKVNNDRPKNGKKKNAAKLAGADKNESTGGAGQQPMLWMGNECWPPIESLERVGTKLLGMKDLTRIALEAKDAVVGQAAINLICAMHTKLNNNKHLRAKTESIHQELFALSLESISTSTTNATDAHATKNKHKAASPKTKRTTIYSETAQRTRTQRAALLLRTFLASFSNVGSDMLNIVILPPMGGVPGSLLRRDALASTAAAGPTLISISASTPLYRLRRTIAQTLGYLHDPTHLNLRLVNVPSYFQDTLFVDSNSNGVEGGGLTSNLISSSSLLIDSSGGRARKESVSETLAGRPGVVSNAGDSAPSSTTAGDGFSKSMGRKFNLHDNTRTLADLGVSDWATIEVGDGSPVPSFGSQDSSDSNSDYMPSRKSMVKTDKAAALVLQPELDPLKVGYQDIAELIMSTSSTSSSSSSSVGVKAATSFPLLVDVDLPVDIVDVESPTSTASSPVIKEGAKEKDGKKYKNLQNSVSEKNKEKSPKNLQKSVAEKNIKKNKKGAKSPKSSSMKASRQRSKSRSKSISNSRRTQSLSPGGGRRALPNTSATTSPTRNASLMDIKVQPEIDLGPLGGLAPVLRSVPYKPYMQSYFDRIFELLDGPSLTSQSAKALWECVLLMPVERGVQTAILGLGGEPMGPVPKSKKGNATGRTRAKARIEDVLPKDKTHKLTYALSVLYGWLHAQVREINMHPNGSVGAAVDAVEAEAALLAGDAGTKKGAASKKGGVNTHGSKSTPTSPKSSSTEVPGKSLARWCACFIKRGGVNHLISIARDHEALGGPQLHTCLAFLFHLITLFVATPTAVETSSPSPSTSATTSKPAANNTSTVRPSSLRIRSPTSKLRRISAVLNASRIGITKTHVEQTPQRQQSMTQRLSVRRKGTGRSVAEGLTSVLESTSTDDISSEPGFHSRMFQDIALPLPTGVQATMDLESVITTVLGALCHAGRRAIGSSSRGGSGSGNTKNANRSSQPQGNVEGPSIDSHPSVSVAGAAPFPLSLLVRLGLRLVVDCVISSPFATSSTSSSSSRCLDAFLNFPQLSELFDCFLLKLQDKSAREETVIALVLLCQDALAHGLTPTQGGGKRTLDYVLLSTALKMLEPIEAASRGVGSAWTNSNGVRARRRIARSCEQYFSLLVHLILLPTCVTAPTSTEPQEDKAIRKIESLYIRLTKALYRHKPMESAESPTRDHILGGLMQTIRAVLRRVPILASKAQPDLMELLYVAFLFPPLAGSTREDEVKDAETFNSFKVNESDVDSTSGRPVFQPTNSTIVYASNQSKVKNLPKPGDAPRAISRESRRTAYALLVELCEHSPGNLNTALQLLQHNGLGVVLQLDGDEADDLRQEWNYNPLEETKGPLQYAGLRNLGATCYMNSLLQQLYMIPSFRRAFSSLPLESLGEDSMMYQVQVMFGALNVSSKHYFDTRPFCGTVKEFDGQPVQLSEQKDVDEFCSLLFDQLEKESKAAKKLLQGEFFGGTLVQQIVSKDVDHPYVSETPEPFYTIQLDIKNKKDICESMDAFVQGDLLAGDSQYLLPTGEKVDATKRYLIKDLPAHLLINLKRFEFNFETMQKQKLNDRCAFPVELDMEPYTYEYITSKDGSATKPTPNREPSYYQYELSGVLAHSGTLDSGHYYSFIREREAINPAVGRQWYEFNDKLVWPYALDRVPQDCFGGVGHVERWVEATKTKVTTAVVRHHSAYILVYDRKVVSGAIAAQGRGGSIRIPRGVRTRINFRSSVVSESSYDSLTDEENEEQVDLATKSNGSIATKHMRNGSDKSSGSMSSVEGVVSGGVVSSKKKKARREREADRSDKMLEHFFRPRGGSMAGTPRSGVRGGGGGMSDGSGVSPRKSSRRSNRAQSSDMHQAMPSRIADKVAKENVEFLFHKNVFDPASFRFLWNILDISMRPVATETGNNGSIDVDTTTQHVALRTIAQFVLSVVSHSSTSETDMRRWYTKLGNECSNDPETCVWILDLVMGDNRDDEFLLVNTLLQDCPLVYVRECFAGLIVTCIETVNAATVGVSGGGSLASPVTRMLLCLSNQLERAGDNVFGCQQYFGLLLSLARLGSNERALFVKADLINRLVDFYTVEHRVFTLSGAHKQVMGADIPEISVLPRLVEILAMTCRTPIDSTSTSKPTAPLTALDGQPHVLTERETVMLLDNTTWLDRVIRTEPQVAKTLVEHFSFDSIADTKFILKFTLDHIRRTVNRRGSGANLLPFLSILSVQLLINDSLKEVRIKQAIPECVGHVNGVLYRKEDDDEAIVFHMTQMLLTLAARSASVRAALLKRKSEWQAWPKLSGRAWISSNPNNNRNSARYTPSSN